jgi:hypothetical protein
VSTLIGGYAVIAVGTVLALVILSQAAPRWAPDEAWGHAVVVAILAGLLPLRWRSARRGSSDALRAVRIIAAVLLVVNVVEACLSVFPGWLRIEMGVIAVLMLALSALVAREAAERRAADPVGAATRQ